MKAALAGSGQEEDPRAFVAGLFACSPEVAEQVLRRGRMRKFPGKAPILRQGDWLTLAFLLVLGRAQALLFSADGQVVLLHEYWPGDLFGALGDLDRVRQECDVVAVEEAQALVLQAAELAMLAQQHGCIGLALSRMLIRRLRQTTERMFERAALSAVGRVYAEVLRQARDAPDLAIRPFPVLSDLALRVATTRETASRAVSAAERRGIIRRDPDALVVVSPRLLEDLII